MELSLEEAFDIMVELIGCGIVLGIIQLILHNEAFITILERLV